MPRASPKQLPFCGLASAGFTLKALWWIAVIVIIVWLLGFVVRTADSGGRKGRWYRW
ncbi:hydrophobic protein [Streptomyces collinus]|uniref:hydrophobic protein n=1 Tax=Streptomyces collinus TaxID=42684 RepID=UPI0033BC2392